MLDDMQFARRTTEATEHQHQGHHRPGNPFAALGNRALEELLQFQLPHQFQSQPWPAELAAVLHADSRRIDLDPLRSHVVEQLPLSTAPAAIGRVLHAQPSLFVELSQVGHHALPRTTLRATRLAECPVGMPLAVLFPVTRADEHARILSPPKGAPKGKVFTTTACRPEDIEATSGR